MTLVNKLQEIFEYYADKRICVVGTSCLGKSTLLTHFPNCVDLDDILWETITEEEDKELNKSPWTEEIGAYFDSIARSRVKIQKGHPIFGTSILDCDVIIYLDISDDLLLYRANNRHANFDDVKNMKLSLENKLKKYIEDNSDIISYSFNIST